MTPDQIALAQLEVDKLQAWITGLAIFLGPLLGVIFTLWFKKRKEQADQQQRLFLTLMAHRKSNPPTFDFVNALNLIDVVFAQHRRVVSLWHEYYDMLCQNTVNWHLAEAKYLDLLFEMARALGYKSLAQTEISKFYSPVAHGNQSQETQQELLRVLKATACFEVEPKTEQ